MASISELLNQKVAAKGLSLAQAADAVGVSLPSMRSALAGSAKPNARSIGKYASFLGMSEADAIALTDGQKRGGKGRKAKGGKRGRPPGKAKAKSGKKSGKGKGKGKRGRPPGKRGRPAGKRRGRPPGKRGPGRPPGPGKRRGRPSGKAKAAANPGIGKRVNSAIKRATASLRKAESYLAKVLKAIKS